MIRVVPAPEPPEFDNNVRRPGHRSVYEMCGQTPPVAHRRAGGPAFKQRTRPDPEDRARTVPITRPEELPPSALHECWREAIPDLRKAYGHLCAYSAVRIIAECDATVDHMVPKAKDWRLAYEWSNLRLSLPRFNACKGDHCDVIDPFEVQEGWFAVELVTGTIHPGEAARQDPELRARVESTVRRLQLNGGELPEARLERIRQYRAEEVRLAYFERHSPFLAAELRRQGRLNPGDT